MLRAWFLVVRELWQNGEDTNGFRRLLQCGVPRPQPRSRSHEAGREQVRVNEADPLRVESVSLDHLSHFAQLRDSHLEQRIQIEESLSPVFH